MDKTTTTTKNVQVRIVRLGLLLDKINGESLD